jgi:hypothetical protein
MAEVKHSRGKIIVVIGIASNRLRKYLMMALSGLQHINIIEEAR